MRRERDFSFAAGSFGFASVRIHARKIHNRDHLLPTSALFSRRVAPRRHRHGVELRVKRKGKEGLRRIRGGVFEVLSFLLLLVASAWAPSGFLLARYTTALTSPYLCISPTAFVWTKAPRRHRHGCVGVLLRVERKGKGV